MPSVVLSPALPSELLAYIVAHCVYPTTLVVCASSDEFVRVCVEEGEDEAEDAAESNKEAGDSHDDDNSRGGRDETRSGKPEDRDGHARRRRRHRWTTVSLLQVAVARHIRVAFVPTVAHLRAFLAAFAPGASPVLPPPPVPSSSRPPSDPPLAPSPPPRPTLLVYGFVALHHDTSEWSAQGIGASAAVLVEAAWRVGWNAVLVEGRKKRRARMAATATATNLWDDAFPAQTLPVLSTVPRRQLQRAGYHPRTRSVRSVLGRWFRFRPGPWEEDKGKEGRGAQGEEALPEAPRAETLQENESLQPVRPAARAYVRDSEGEDDEDEHDEDEHDENNEPTQ